MKTITREEFFKAMRKTFDDGYNLIVKKNKDYARDYDPFANLKFGKIVGLSVEKTVLSRVAEKLARLSVLVEKKDIDVKDEKIEDTILDAINYLAILKTYLETKDN